MAARFGGLSTLSCGRLTVELPGGQVLAVEGSRSGRHARVTLHNWTVLWRLFVASDVGFAESYIDGDWSSPDLAGLLELLAQNCPAVERRFSIPSPMRSLRHALNRNSRRGSRRNIAAHYDLGNAFYAHWLDRGMNYSSALYSSTEQSLEAAQHDKLARVCELLELHGDERILEIGCGWGALVEHLIERYRGHVTALTLSQRQFEFARTRLQTRGLLDRADIRLQDYRDVDGSYDRIVSIEMFEAVGAAYWPVYFQKLRERLKPGGIAVLQVITIDDRRFENYRRHPDFIQRYIFPGGMLPTSAIIEREAAAVGLEPVTKELFGASYAQTLLAWNRRFQHAWPSIEPLGFDARFMRAWEYYLSYCQAGFAAGLVDVGLYKLRKPPIRSAGLPLVERCCGSSRHASSAAPKT